MNEGAAIVVAVAALVAVVFYNNRTAQQTATKVNAITAQKQNAGLTAGDVFNVGATVVATAAGGPKAGVAVAGITGLRL